MTPLINTHCHSGFCGHGEGEIQAYVDEACRRGVKLLAFTEHYPLSRAFDPKMFISVPPERLEDYKQAVREARERNDDIEILLGCELDYLGADEDRTLEPKDFEDFEIVLGSVHYIDRWAFDDPSVRDRWDEPGAPDEIWKRYFELWCAAVSDADAPYQIMAHPDLPKKFNYYPTYGLTALYEQAAEAAAASDRIVEINTSGAYYACEEMFPSPELLRAFCRAGVPITVGCDAHKPENVARGIDQAYGLLREAGYRKVTVPTSDGDRRCWDL